MSSIKVNFEISHEATRRSKDTPEGFTHDWEVVVRGQEGADISHFVDKVVFNLHNSFPKPRRVVKEPPFSIKESGYAGFNFPIEIHLKNKNEPKKIQFYYNLTFQPCGSLRDRYIFQNPNDEFRRKLLKGGGIIVSNDTFYTNPDQESRSRDSFSNEKPQLVSKPKLSSENIKKHKTKEKIKDEVPHKTNSFENLFGAPIQKPPKVSPDPKRIEKSVIKTEKKEKDRSSEKKSKHEHKEVKTEKIKVKEEREKQKSDKVKSVSKDSEKVKEKSNKRPGERPPSPDLIKKKCVSPVRKPPSPVQMSNASSMKEEYRSSSKNNIENFDQKKVKTEDRPVEVKVEKEKKKKDKKSHDRDKDRKDKKEHKKESHKNKESPKDASKIVNTSKDSHKEREAIKDSQPKEKPSKPDKPINKFSIENLKKTPPSANEERLESHKVKEKSETERKHKHKKKDKKRDESKEKHKDSSKEKKRKHDKPREVPQDKPEHDIELRDTPVPKEHLITETASPISVDSASQSSESKSGLTKPLIKAEDNSSHSESEDSIIADDEDVKIKVEAHSPEPVKREPTPEPEAEPEPEPEPELEIEPVPELPPVQQKEKSKKHKDKSKREEKRRKRKAAEEEDAENRKIPKVADPGPTNHDNEHGESSGSISIETKVQDNGVSSSLGEDGESGDLSPDYMVQLRGLQQRIMMIKNNEDLERVVNLIAETGRYEVTTQTFDFDLCLLDRSTVQQLIQLVGC